MEKILVLGGTGNIGFPLVKALAQKSVTITVGVRNPEKDRKKFTDFSNVTVKKFDFLDPSTFTEALADVDRAFFIRPPQLAKPKEDMFPFLEAVKTRRLKQLVFVSLIGVDKNPMTPHHKIEKRIEELAIPYTFIRPSFFMQNLNTTHLEDIRDHHDLFIPAGNAKTSFIDTRDIGAVAAEVLTTDNYLGKTLDITGKEALTYTQIAETMTNVLQVKITYSKPSLFKFRKVMLGRGIKKDYVNVMVMLYLITQLGNAKSVTDTVEKILGRPATTFAQYVHDYRQDFLGK